MYTADVGMSLLDTSSMARRVSSVEPLSTEYLLNQRVFENFRVKGKHVMVCFKLKVVPHRLPFVFNHSVRFNSKISAISVLESAETPFFPPFFYPTLFCVPHKFEVKVNKN